MLNTESDPPSIANVLAENEPLTRGLFPVPISRVESGILSAALSYPALYPIIIE